MSVILGVDYGERRMGTAVSDGAAILAIPLRTIEINSRAQGVKAISEVCAERGADMIVVGLPLNMDGTKGPMAERVEAFVEALSQAVGIRVETWDERLSTMAAERTLLDADMSRKRRKQVRDKLAAQIILQGYLDAGHGPEA